MVEWEVRLSFAKILMSFVNSKINTPTLDEFLHLLNMGDFGRISIWKINFFSNLENQSNLFVRVKNIWTQLPNCSVVRALKRKSVFAVLNPSQLFD